MGFRAKEGYYIYPAKGTERARHVIDKISSQVDQENRFAKLFLDVISTVVWDYLADVNWESYRSLMVLRGSRTRCPVKLNMTQTKIIARGELYLEARDCLTSSHFEELCFHCGLDPDYVRRLVNAQAIEESVAA